MKPANVKDNTYIYFNKKNRKEDPKFKIIDHARISKYKKIFAKGLKNPKTLFFRHMLLTVRKLLERFTKNNCKKKSNSILYNRYIKNESMFS